MRQRHSFSGTVTAEQRFVLAEPSQIESSFTDQEINTVLQPRTFQMVLH